jgi:hypothetical protein
LIVIYCTSVVTEGGDGVADFQIILAGVGAPAAGDYMF